MGSSNRGYFEECWTPLSERDPGEDNAEGSDTPRGDIALEANAIVQERGEHYGPPSENHSCTAGFWRAYLKRRYGVEIPLDSEDVCWLNVLQKVSRQAHVRKRDNSLDVIGFVINVDMLE